MAPFYRWGWTASRLEPLWGDSLLFTIKFTEIPGTHLLTLEGWTAISTVYCLFADTEMPHYCYVNPLLLVCWHKNVTLTKLFSQGQSYSNFASAAFLDYIMGLS